MPRLLCRLPIADCLLPTAGRLPTALLTILPALLLAAGLHAGDPFLQLVRPTGPLTAEQEAKSFHLPPGFEIHLVACEPEINKPMNIAFDERGRLWVTSTVEYPWPVKDGVKGRDSIKILEDTDGDFRADKITTFADGLNIPIGIYPYKGGAIAYSIPNVHYFQDTDGDGQADKRDVLYGAIGSIAFKDTHGMASSFTRGFDGWMYATHGFNNESVLRAGDGSSIKLHSGNTFRVRLDGSHIEQFTWGQVNPFGMALDPLGNLYTADCHSLPIFQLLRGAYYISFGKPHDGLGFGPAMMSHSHKSTGLCGVIDYAADAFPKEFQRNLFVGNVVTSRINREIVEEHGSTRIAKEAADFLSTDDPWFRPVNMALAPDGSIYVADFYNKIIGHYEVDLKHPERDRERGRIWRISYKGANAEAKKANIMDQSKATADELIANLAHPNLSARMFAMNQLIDRIGKPAVEPLLKMMGGKNTPYQRIHGLWTLWQFQALQPEMLDKCAKDEDRGVRVHAMRVLAEIPEWTAAQRELALAGLKDADAFVQRASADAAGRHPHLANLRPLLDLRHAVPPDDTHLLHVVRMALRDHLKAPELAAKLPLPEWNEKDNRAMANVAPGSDTPATAAFLLRYMQKIDDDVKTTSSYLKQIIPYLKREEADGLVSTIRQRFPVDADIQFNLFTSIQGGYSRHGLELNETMRAWGAELAGKLLATEGAAAAWTALPLEGRPASANPFVLQKRDSADAKNGQDFICSFPPGEQLTGVLRSKPFAIPAKLSFFMAGHNGEPKAKDQKKNVLRLLSADGNSVLAEQFPPRNDLAQQFSWDLAAHAGKQGYLEIVDGDTASAYAWLAVGRFSPALPELELSGLTEAAPGTRRLKGIEIARTLKLSALQPQLEAALAGGGAPELRGAAAAALLAIDPAAHSERVARILNDGSASLALREKLAAALGEIRSPAAQAVLAGAFVSAPERFQGKLALALAGDPAGAELLLKTVEAGKASPRLLQDTKLKERLGAAKIDKLGERLGKLTKGLEAPDNALLKLLAKRRAEYNPAKANLEQGAKVFTQSCAVCHQLEGKGALIGPQLDGMASRGLERLVEDVLDPNLNVDPAFRSSVVVLNDGKIVTGLQKREEGDSLIFVDTAGKEISVPKKEIKNRKESAMSLMPDNVGQLLSAEDFNHLMGYLLSKSVPVKKP